ncbi:MAG: hypothetical protein ACYCZS_12900 [Thiobacillus sp.]
MFFPLRPVATLRARQARGDAGCPIGVPPFGCRLKEIEMDMKPALNFAMDTMGGES